MLPFQTENGSAGDFLLSVYRLLIVLTEVCRLSDCRRRNGSYLFANGPGGLNGLNCLNGLVHLCLKENGPELSTFC